MDAQNAMCVPFKSDFYIAVILHHQLAFLIDISIFLMFLFDELYHKKNGLNSKQKISRQNINSVMSGQNVE